MVDRTVTNEREKFISKLSEENAALKTNLQKMTGEFSHLKDMLSNKEKECA